MQKLLSYFTDGVTSKTLETIGSEVETQFVDDSGTAITERTSQLMLHFLAESGWNVERRKGHLITTLEKGG